MNIFQKFFNNFSDHQKRTIKSSGKKGSYFDEIASIKTVNGMYNTLKKISNPDEILKKSSKGYETLRLLENEGQVAACVESRNAGVSSLNWQLTNLDKKYEDFYNHIFEKINIYDLIKDILKAPLYGFQPIEIIWEQSPDGYIVPAEIIAKPQEWFFYNAERELCFNQKGNNDGLVITPEMRKFLIPTHSADYLNPYGKSVLSRCFWDVTFKKGGVEFWLKFAEKYGMPYAIGKYEDGMSDNEIDNLVKSLDNMIQDAVAAIPNNSTIELISSSDKSGSTSLYSGIIEMCDKNIAKNILGQTLTTDSDGNGSYALGQVHATVRQDIITSDKRLVESWINVLLRWIHELNFGTDDEPKFELYEEQDIDKDLAERDKILVDTGVQFTKKYYIKTYGLEDEDFEIKNQTNSSDFAEQEDKEANNPIFAIDELINSFSDEDMGKMVESQILEIVKNFNENKNMDELEQNLAVLFPQMDSNQMEETLTKVIFVSDLWGRANATEE